jgi:hypothetical protein
MVYMHEHCIYLKFFCGSLGLDGMGKRYLTTGWRFAVKYVNSDVFEKVDFLFGELNQSNCSYIVNAAIST